MKNAIKNFLFTAAVLCLVATIVETPVSAAVPMSKTTVLSSPPFGGAYLLFAGKYGGSITKKELEGQSKLGVEGCAKGSRIFQFTLVVTKGGKSTSLEASSNTLTKEMVDKLKSLSSGDSFEFKGVKAYMAPKNDVIEVRTQKFTVA